MAAEEEAVELPEADPEADVDVLEAPALEAEPVAVEAAEEVVAETAAEVIAEEELATVLLAALPAEPVDIRTAVVASAAAEETHVPATLLWKS